MPIILIGIITSIVTFFQNPSMITGLLAVAFILILFATYFARTYALKAQDRAARAEEKLRYFIMAGKSFPNEMTMSQILALRFASDEEYLLLVQRAITEKLSADDIKKSVKNWRADNHRI
ncbi:hypothetical protein EZJ43_10590 [Pedobacter changchengzhani]|uniref:Uncharacterized protein n=2 Tax=Pedobacter changchengzhani TaxID=2529274 RepID=A0A4R5MLY4_9SPHI|nr:hypothetical protein EZJ43_10590 [Pedobacter changchengzhani]